MKSNRLIKVSPKLKYDLRISFKKFQSRIKIAFGILFRRYDHWFFVNFDMKQLVKLVQEEDFDVTITKHGLQNYNVRRAIKMMANAIDDDDMVLEKGDFEAHAEILKEQGFIEPNKNKK